MIRVQFNNTNASSLNMAMSHNYGRNQNIFVCIFVKHTRKEYFRKHERLTQYSVSSILSNISLYYFCITIASRSETLLVKIISSYEHLLGQVCSHWPSVMKLFLTPSSGPCGGLFYPLIFTLNIVSSQFHYMYLQPALLSRSFCPETVLEIFLNKKK